MLCREPYIIESGDSSCGEAWAGRDHSDITNTAQGCSLSFDCLQPKGCGTFCVLGCTVLSRLAQSYAAPGCSSTALPSPQQQGKRLHYFFYSYTLQRPPATEMRGRKAKINFIIIIIITVSFELLHPDGVTQWLKGLMAWSKGHSNCCWDTRSSQARTSREKRKINLLVSNTYFVGTSHMCTICSCAYVYV